MTCVQGLPSALLFCSQLCHFSVRLYMEGSAPGQPSPSPPMAMLLLESRQVTEVLAPGLLSIITCQGGYVLLPLASFALKWVAHRNGTTEPAPVRSLAQRPAEGGRQPSAVGFSLTSMNPCCNAHWWSPAIASSFPQLGRAFGLL